MPNLTLPSVLAHGLDRFQTVRSRTEELAAPLSAEDQTVQSMPDASPTKWHLAHTTWFFETFVLRPHATGYRPFDPAFDYLFNSYYEAVGPRHPRPQRGMITRPGVEEVMAYRRHVTGAMLEFLAGEHDAHGLIELGLQHEQQHQELILMDIKHALSMNPLRPAYRPAKPPDLRAAEPLAWREFEGGLVEIGYDGRGFAFDNEGPRHRCWLDSFAIAMRPVNCGEYLAFMKEGGYRRAEFWLSAGWDCVNRNGWEAPLYWEQKDGAWCVFTLSGLEPVDPARPVCHVSAFEAAAFAKWAGKRLPREAEWETAADALPECGAVWEWTASPYVAYPGYREPPGAIGEYNGKFMASQMVLRGGCSATPEGHVRPTYRNFFPPDARWMFGGIRLAEDLR
ncbi:ergothioneine biosynthesis protein EgtB [Reyranella aquatilis]|uniref:Ergothioneine biosynthesis protein EgtB n=1 Tax=Reyranella aquatilis TaxID=2035356 RepID=A0ABS8L0C6_9HYPH|nr:ergothioneine biosynthesis protein EgtB [Reyranella aquatilis]MCC8431762.1 ergothioneine biosynthesis protein EgtB [Reyranella aquatilis]